MASLSNRAVLLAAALAAATTACDGASSAPPPLPTAAATTEATAIASAAQTTAASATASAQSSATSSAAAADDEAIMGIGEPPLFGPDGELLEQTKDEPTIDSAVFKARLEKLFQAIQRNDPEVARSFFFPVQAYEQVKAIKKAAADWNWRLWKRFKRDVGKYHKRLGSEPEGAELLRVELRNKPQWMKPGREGNRIGYYRVTRSWLHYKTAEGKEKHFEITSMISWRGEWTVVHLHGFK